MQFEITGRIIKCGISKKDSKPWANILVEGRGGAADVSMVFPLNPVSLGQVFKGLVDGQVQFLREVLPENKEKK
jgi:hypothetical protein